MATKKTKFGKGFQIKVNLNSDNETPTRQLIVDGAEKGEAFKAFRDPQDVESSKKPEGYLPPMRKTEYYKRLEELTKNIYLKPTEPCDLEVLKTDEFPIVRLRNKETFQDLTKFLGKVVETKPLKWPPFLGYRICTKVNKKMIRCLVVERKNEDQILGISILSKFIKSSEGATQFADLSVAMGFSCTHTYLNF